jgi:hypothetical protein
MINRTKRKIIMIEYIKTAFANQYTRATLVGLIVGTAAIPYSTASNNIQPKSNLENKLETSQKIYKITCPEGFTPLKWTLGEGYNVTDKKSKEMYETLNGEGHLPQPGRSTLFLQDFDGNKIIANVKVTADDEVTNLEEIKQLKERREKRYNYKQQ